MHKFAHAVERAGFRWRPWPQPGERDCVAVELDAAGDLFVLGVKLRQAGWSAAERPLVDTVQRDRLVAYWPKYLVPRPIVPFP